MEGGALPPHAVRRGGEAAAAQQGHAMQSAQARCTAHAAGCVPARPRPPYPQRRPPTTCCQRPTPNGMMHCAPPARMGALAPPAGRRVRAHAGPMAPHTPMLREWRSTRKVAQRMHTHMLKCCTHGPLPSQEEGARVWLPHPHRHSQRAEDACSAQEEGQARAVPRERAEERGQEVDGFFCLGGWGLLLLRSFAHSFVIV